jgi:hypothetical protein
MNAWKMMLGGLLALALAVVGAPAWASSYDDLILIENRYGNRSTTGTWELGMSDVTPYTLYDTDQYRWTSGAWENFTLSYDGLSTLSYTLGGRTLSTSLAGGPSMLTYLEIGGVAYRSNTSVQVANMFVNGTALPDSLFVNPSISGGDLTVKISSLPVSSGAFTLTGQTKLTFSGASGLSSSNLESQIYVGLTHAPVVPEPGTLLLMGSGLLAAGLARRRARAA